MGISEEIRRNQYTVKRELVASAIQSDVAHVTRVMEGTRSLKLDQVEPFLDSYGYQILPVGYAAVDPEELAALRTLADAHLQLAAMMPDSAPEVKKAMATLGIAVLQKAAKSGEITPQIMAALAAVDSERLRATFTPHDAPHRIQTNNERLRCSNDKDSE